MKINSKTIETVLEVCALIACFICFFSINNVNHYADKVKQYHSWIDYSDQLIRDEIKFDSISNTEKIDMSELNRILDFKENLKDSFESDNTEYVDKQVKKIYLFGFLFLILFGISFRLRVNRLKKSNFNE